jgi:cytosine/uracil/thiamine/allantoin permease
VRFKLPQALLAILVGNLIYFLLAAHVPALRHHTFQADAGWFVDFFICLALYVIILKVAEKKS